MTSSLEDNDKMIILPISSVGNGIKYHTEIWYTEIFNDADIDHGRKFQKT